MVMSIDTSLLTAYFNAKAGLSADGTSLSTSTSSTGGKANPTPPWSSTSTAPQPSTLLQTVLSGGKFIDPGAAKLDVAGGNSTTTANYKATFALYQGLSALQALANRMSTPNLSSAERKQIEQAFQSGLTQVQTYVDTKPFSGFDVVQGALMSSDQSTIGAPVETDTYTTGILHTGAATDEVDAFKGPMQFNLTVTKYSGTQVPVAFDLSEMGSTPRTMSNVVSYLNSKLEAAGVETRFANQITPAAPRTIQVGGQSVTLPSVGDSFALKIKGSAVETLSFSAPNAAPAVYVGQSVGVAGTDADQQLVKFDASSAPTSTDNSIGKVFTQSLGANTSAVHATVTAPDGSVYVLADITGPAADGEPIKGSQDVALLKYDSAGNLLYSRTLGAASSASGLALAVSPDGKQVAVAGSVTGDLNAGDKQAGATTSDTFVTVYDAAGQEQWTQRGGSDGANDQINAVAFGADGTVYVAGQTDGALAGGGGAHGVTDGFVTAYHAKSMPTYDGNGGQEWVVTPTYTSQFGTSGVDKAVGLTVSNGQVYVASVENGHATLRAFTDNGNGQLTAGATRDLGDLQGGSIAGVTTAADGSIIVAGSTHNGALNAGSVTQAYAGGKEAFVASLSADLQPSAGDRLTYIGDGTSDQTASAVTVSGGQVYIAGQIAKTPIPGAGQTTANDGYVAAIDPQTGQVTWSQRYNGLDQQAAPTSIAVAQGGASVLDRLGLPSGTINYSSSQQVVANTSLRPGDQFFIKAGSVSQAVTIAADDTYETLAQKIMRASGFNATVTLTKVDGATQLKITANGGTPVEIYAGANGKALTMLGLREGTVSKTADQATQSAAINKPAAGGKATTSLQQAYSLNLPTSLTLSTASGLKAAQAAIAYAISEVQNIYRNMTTAPSTTSSSTSSGSVPTYLTNQIANYQAALDRLTGGS